MSQPAHAYSEWRPAAALAFGVAFLALAWVTMSLRLWTRALIIKSLGWDDWAMLLTTLLFTAQCGLLIEMSVLEMPVHTEATLHLLTRLYTYATVYIGIYLATAIVLKISLAIFFLRIVHEKWQRCIILVGLVVHVLFNFAFIFVALFQCGDGPDAILRGQIEGTCAVPWSVLKPMNYTGSAISVVTDWTYALLPILMVRKANMPQRAKLSVCLILVLGVAGSVMSLVRLAYIPGLDSNGIFIYKATKIALYSTAEMGFGIAAGSLATLRPLFQRCLERVRTDRVSRTRTNLTGKRTGPRSGQAMREWKSDIETGRMTAVTTIVGGPEAVRKEHSEVTSTMMRIPSKEDAYTYSFSDSAATACSQDPSPEKELAEMKTTMSGGYSRKLSQAQQHYHARGWPVKLDLVMPDID